MNQQRLLNAVRRLALLALLGMLCGLANGAHSVQAVSKMTGIASTRAWRGGTDDPRWSNPLIWESGHVPAATDQVRLPTDAGDGHVAAAFAGQVAAITLEKGYAGVLTLDRMLDVRGALVVNSGTVETGADALSVETLTIGRDAIVRMGANGKLNLSGDTAPLTGDGLFDTTTNTPNSVEYTGHATSDLMASGPASAFHQLRPDRLVPMGASLQGRCPSNTASPQPLAAAAFTKTSSLTLNAGESDIGSAVIDTAAGFAYFGTFGTPGVIVKVRLSDFTRVGALVFDGNTQFASGLIDMASGFAYFGGYSSPGVIVKVRLSDFTVEDKITMNAGEDKLRSAVIDTTHGFAYFATSTLPATIVKVRLSDFTRVDALTLNLGENGPTAAVIDAANDFAYFGAMPSNVCPDPSSNVSTVVKVRLTDFTRVGALSLDTTECFPRSAVIDTANGFAYFGTGTFPGIVVKVRLSDFTRMTALTLNSGENFLSSAVIDPANGFAYFGTNPSPGMVVKVRLSDLSRVGALTLTARESGLNAAAIDATGGSAYFGTFTSPGIVVKVNIGIADRLVLSKSASAATVNAGDTLTYTLAILNDSSTTATGVTLTDTLPAAVSFVSASPGCGLSGGAVVCGLQGPDIAGALWRGRFGRTIAGKMARGSKDNAVAGKEERAGMGAVTGADHAFVRTVDVHGPDFVACLIAAAGLENESLPVRREIGFSVVSVEGEPGYIPHVAVGDGGFVRYGRSG